MTQLKQDGVIDRAAVATRLSAVMQAEADAIAAVKVSDGFIDAVEILYSCKAKIITTGIGKAGLVAQKLSSTLCSTATTAIFMHAAEAAHGDLGVVEEGDVLVAFSTSGRSDEVLAAVELAQHHLGLAKVIGITSHPESALRNLSDVVVDMGVVEEPCRLGLTPSASIAVMTAVADALTLTLMDLKGVSRADYGIRHHGGYLGRRSRIDNE